MQTTEMNKHGAVVTYFESGSIFIHWQFPCNAFESCAMEKAWQCRNCEAWGTDEDTGVEHGVNRNHGVRMLHGAETSSLVRCLGDHHGIHESGKQS